MNREIKFRVWVTDDNEMQFPLVFSNVGNSFKPLIKCKDGNRAYKDYPVMQYTGLKDKDGKEIYEGDICEGHSGGIGIITWSNFDGGYDYIFSDEANVGIWEVKECIKVIGNIYSNPELLNK